MANGKFKATCYVQSSPKAQIKINITQWTQTLVLKLKQKKNPKPYKCEVSQDTNIVHTLHWTSSEQQVQNTVVNITELSKFLLFMKLIKKMFKKYPKTVKSTRKYLF